MSDPQPTRAATLRLELLAAKAADDPTRHEEAEDDARAYLIEHGWTLEGESTWHHAGLQVWCGFDGALRLQVIKEFDA